ncbi:zinc dependent phospholipase C family protein [Paenibacillus albus]|uniref:Phospholipase C/D domain-containing protein n=1 Tax=Paenibacillus albus TaxID=2495582 RepID=A0A3Q8X8V8_9BACL|nr:zinc dependent phospholipase C family protein [Paenibacillus albus]AZN42823.1 hypothetical protein EJC50_26370 [Paenibacillus albus]
MPNIWTHFLFGQKCLQEIGETSLISAPHLERMFNMGCQGPDFLFYHNFLPWKKDPRMNLLGSEMHQHHCGEVIMDMLDTLEGQAAPQSKQEPALVYALGFLLHHLLDRVMHPYVFSRSGSRKWDHQRFEIMMDTLIARKLHGVETWKTEVWKEIDIRGELPTLIVNAFEQIAAVHYPALAARISREDWRDAMRDMVAAQKLFYDPTGMKRLFTFGQIDPFVFKRELPPLDILNDSNRPWLDPTDGKTLHTESVWDLWNLAMEEALPVVRAVLHWLRTDDSSQPELTREAPSRYQLREEAAQLIGNRSYETGLPCESMAAIRYEDPIWPSSISL